MYNIYGAVNLIIASHTLFWLILVSRIQHGLGKQLSKILIKKWKSSSVSSVSSDQELNIAPKTCIQKKKKLYVWMSHELTIQNRMVTGVEKLVTYEDRKRKRSSSNRGE